MKTLETKCDICGKKEKITVPCGGRFPATQEFLGKDMCDICANAQAFN